MHISVKELLKGEMKKNPQYNRMIQNYLDTGSNMPETLINQLIMQRLKQVDCKVNGYILDGFPRTET